jgi:voltage-gated potassium channel
MKTPASFRHLKIAVCWVLGVLILGTCGYMLIEHMSFVDALYTAVDMIATVGSAAHPLSASGRLFTIIVLVLGVGSLLYAFGVGMEFVIEGHFNREIRRRFMDRKIDALRDHYVVCGYGRVGSQIAEDFSARKVPFVIIDEKEQLVEQCIQRGYLVKQGDATSDEVLLAAGIQRARCLLAATDNDANNIYITLSARHLNKKLFIVARANHDDTGEKLKLAGADRVLSPYTIGGHRMANLALQPTVVEFLDAVTRAGNIELAVQEVIISPTSPLIGKTMAAAQNTMKDGTMIVAVKKAGKLMSGTRAQTCIEQGDAIIVVGAPEQLASLKREHSLR